MFFLPSTIQKSYSNANLIPSDVLFDNEGDSGTPVTGNHILTEGGDKIALENGDLLITET